MNAKNCYIDRVLNRFAAQITNLEVLNRLADDITDRVFFMIENDRELSQDYCELVNSGTNQHGLNSSLGKQIRVKFNLKNAGRCNNPKSTLIRSYERHKINTDNVNRPITPVDLLEQHFKNIIAEMPEEFTFHQFVKRLAHQHQHEYIVSLLYFSRNDTPFRALHGELERRIHIGSYGLTLVNSNEPSEDIFGTASHCGKWRKQS